MHAGTLTFTASTSGTYHYLSPVRDLADLAHLADLAVLLARITLAMIRSAMIRHAQ